MILEWIRRFGSLQRREATPAEGEVIWFDQLPGANETDRRDWVGSRESGAVIVVSRRLTGHIGQMCDLIQHDRVFRRSLIAHKDALETLRELLNLPRSDLVHSCMLALVSERGNQLSRYDQQTRLWGCELFRELTGIGRAVHLQPMIEKWWEEFQLEYGPKEDL